MGGRFGRLARAVKREVIALIPATLFFMILFHLLAFTRSLALAEYSVNVNFTVVATVGALIIAKVIIVADNLPLINVFRNKPLIVDVLWRTLIYGIFALAIQYLEELLPHLVHTWSFTEANQLMAKDIAWPQFWANHLWLLFGLLIYCSASGLVRAVGPERVRALFLKGTSQHTNNT